MTLDVLVDTLPAYANDLKTNYSSVVGRQSELTVQQAWGTVVASAITARSRQLIAAALAEAATRMSPQALDAARSAAAIMAMNNIFFRFRHLASHERYATMRSGLRMNAVRTHGIASVDFELWATAASAINGCGACMAAHERVLREKGLGEEKVLAAVRIASVIQAIAVVLDAEAAERG